MVSTLMLIVVSIMSPPTLLTTYGSLLIKMQGSLVPGAQEQGKDELSARIEEQRAKIRALEVAAEERKRADQLRIQEGVREAESIKRQRLRVAVSTGDRFILDRRQEERRREDRLGQEETSLQSLLGHKTSVAGDIEDAFQERPALSNLQGERLREDKLEPDEALFHQMAEERGLVRITEKERRKEELRLVKIREKEARDLVKIREKEARDRASRERGQLLARQQDNQRRRERAARDQACLRALERHEAAVKAERARKAEERKLATEQKPALLDQRDQQRRMEKQRRDEEDARQRAIREARRAQEAENYRLREEQRVAAQRAREQKQLLRDQQDKQRRLDLQARDEAGMQALSRYEAAARARKAQEAEERRLGRLTERERLPKEQGQASHDRRH
jgi:hypothetical protein